MKELQNIKLYQGEEQDILKRPPSLLVKVGTLLICLILIGIIIISKFIFIPEIITTELTIKRNQINYLIASQDTIIKNTTSNHILQLGDTIARYGNKDIIISPLDGFLLEKNVYATSFVNKGDTLFKLVPVEKGKIQSSFKIHTKYKTLIQSGTDNNILIDKENKSFTYQIYGIKNLQRDSIEVNITTAPKLLEYTFPTKDGDYRLPIQVAVNQQSVFDRLLSCLHFL